jgi:hypothetical protein
MHLGARAHTRTQVCRCVRHPDAGRVPRSLDDEEWQLRGVLIMKGRSPPHTLLSARCTALTLHPGARIATPAAMNNATGLNAALTNPQAVRTLALCLATANLKVKLVVVELLGAIWSGGRAPHPMGASSLPCTSDTASACAFGTALCLPTGSTWSSMAWPCWRSGSGGWAVWSRSCRRRF